MHQPQPFCSVERLCGHAHPFEVHQQVRLDSAEFRPRLLQGIGTDTEGEVFCLDQAIVSLCDLPFQHGSVFGAHIIEGVILTGDLYPALKLGCVCRCVDKGDLKGNRAVKEV